MTNFSLFSGPAVETEKKYHAKRKKKKTGSDLINDLITPRQLLKITMVLNRDFLFLSIFYPAAISLVSKTTIVFCIPGKRHTKKSGGKIKHYTNKGLYFYLR